MGDVGKLVGVLEPASPITLPLPSDDVEHLQDYRWVGGWVGCKVTHLCGLCWVWGLGYHSCISQLPAFMGDVVTLYWGGGA